MPDFKVFKLSVEERTFDCHGIEKSTLKNGSVRFVDAGCVPTFFVFNGSVGVFVSTSVGGT